MVHLRRVALLFALSIALPAVTGRFLPSFAFPIADEIGFAGRTSAQVLQVEREPEDQQGRSSSRAGERLFGLLGASLGAALLVTVLLAVVIGRFAARRVQFWGWGATGGSLSATEGWRFGGHGARGDREG